ncbi:MAG: hypothetical protein ACTSV7_05330, partial [Candidatus Baldrarchaeia archaeon]
MREEVSEKALTWKTYLAFLFSTMLIQPIMIYYNLISNIILPLATWIPIILWAELSNFLRSKLSKKELFMILAFQPIALTYAFFFLNFVRNLYYSESEPAIKLGITQYIPSWWVPKGSAFIDVMNSKFIFFNEVWLIPIGLSLLVLFLGFITEIVIGYLSYEVFAVVEKLEFPSAKAQVATIETLAERDPNLIRALFVSALFGSIVHLVGKFLPFFIGPFIYGGAMIYAYAMPYFDLTPYLDYLFPGAGFIIPIDPQFYIPGFLLPIKVTFFQFIGAFALYFIGSHFVTEFKLWPQESLWSTGWGYWTLQYRSLLYFFVSLIIGLSFSAMIVPLILNPAPLKRGIRALSKSMTASKGIFSPKLLLLLYLASSLSLVLVVWALTNFSFPVWILLLVVVGGSFFANYISTASAGVTFLGLNIPYLRELSIYYSGYPKKDIWFAPLPLSISGTVAQIGPTTTMTTTPLGGSAIAQGFLQADLLGVKHSEYIKAYVILLGLSLLSSFIFTNFFWYMSPIPSSAYPATIIYWPVDALSWARMQVWVWSGYLFKSEWIMTGLGLGTAISVITYVLKMPYALIMLITGALMGIPFAFAQFLASIIGDKFIKPTFGADKWYRYRPLIVMGYLLGDGLMEIFRTVIIMVTKSSWL